MSRLTVNQQKILMTVCGQIVAHQYLRERKQCILDNKKGIK